MLSVMNGLSFKARVYSIKGTLENIQASGLCLAWPRTEVLFRESWSSTTGS